MERAAGVAGARRRRPAWPDPRGHDGDPLLRPRTPWPTRRSAQWGRAGGSFARHQLLAAKVDAAGSDWILRAGSGPDWMEASVT